MKKLVIFCLTLSFFTAFSQEFSYEFSSKQNISLPDLQDYDRFYQMEYEMESKVLPNKLSEIQKDKLPEFQYNYRKTSSTEQKVSLRIINHLYGEATYINGLIEGIKIIYHANGTIYREANYIKGKLEGIEKYFSVDNDLILETNYKNGLKHGKRILYTQKSNKAVVEGTYENGKLISDIKISDKYQTLIVPSDMKKGKVKQYNNDFLTAEYEIISPKLIHGEAKIYNYGTGILIAKMPYNFGKINGEAIYYNDKGELLSKLPYKNGTKIGEHKIYTNNKMISEVVNFDEFGEKSGVWEKYNSNGNLYTSSVYKNDKRNGESIIYNPDGTLKSSYYYVDNKLEGISRKYEKGVLDSEINYENDKTITYKKFYVSGKLFYINEKLNEKYQTTYYDRNGNIIHQNLWTKDEKPKGIHKQMDLKNDEIVFNNETHYDDFGASIKYIYKSGNGTVETLYRNNQMHGKKIYYNEDGSIFKEEYYFNAKLVTKEEFETLSKAEKK